MWIRVTSPGVSRSGELWPSNGHGIWLDCRRLALCPVRAVPLDGIPVGAADDQQQDSVLPPAAAPGPPCHPRATAKQWGRGFQAVTVVCRSSVSCQEGVTHVGPTVNTSSRPNLVHITSQFSRYIDLPIWRQEASFGASWFIERGIMRNSRSSAGAPSSSSSKRDRGVRWWPRPGWGSHRAAATHPGRPLRRALRRPCRRRCGRW